MPMQDEAKHGRLSCIVYVAPTPHLSPSLSRGFCFCFPASLLKPSPPVFASLRQLVTPPPPLPPSPPVARAYLIPCSAWVPDPVCVLLVMYVSYLFLLRRHDSSAVLVAQRRRLAALPVAVAVAVYFSVKLAAVYGNDSQGASLFCARRVEETGFGDVFGHIR